MSRFTDKLCPVCRIPFKDDDDVVVCPECGTPHHRDCYKQIGRCGVEQYHADGFVWSGRLPDEPVEEPKESVAQAAAQENTSPHHADLPPYTPPQFAPPPKSGEEIPEVEELKSISHYFDVYKKIRELTDDDKRGEDGVSSKELCHFAGKSVVHYSQAFSAFRVGVVRNGEIRPVKIFLNFCAGLFAPIHQFYRRMDFLAIPLLLLMAVTSIPDGMLLFDINNDSFSFNETTLDMLNKLSALSTFINFAITMALCVFGDYIYYKFCVRRIKKIRALYDDGNAAGYYAALAENGSPSKLRIVIGVLALMLVSQIVYYAPQYFLIK